MFILKRELSYTQRELEIDPFHVLIQKFVHCCVVDKRSGEHLFCDSFVESVELVHMHQPAVIILPMGDDGISAETSG